MRQSFAFPTASARFEADLPDSVITGRRESSTAVVARGRSQVVVFSTAWGTVTRRSVRNLDGRGAPATLFEGDQPHVAWPASGGEIRTEARNELPDEVTADELVKGMLIDAAGPWPKIQVLPPLGPGNIREVEERDRVVFLSASESAPPPWAISFVLDGGLRSPGITGDDVYGATAFASAAGGVTVGCSGPWDDRDKLQALAESVAASLVVE